jgi:hypothetical protein
MVTRQNDAILRQSGISKGEGKEWAGIHQFLTKSYRVNGQEILEPWYTLVISDVVVLSAWHEY